MSKVVAFVVCAALAFGGVMGFAPWRALMLEPQGSWAVAIAGGLFTIAIAVLIRD